LVFLGLFHKPRRHFSRKGFTQGQSGLTRGFTRTAEQRSRRGEAYLLEEKTMSIVLIETILFLSSITILLLFLISLKKLGTAPINFAILLMGINHIFVSFIIPFITMKSICLLLGIFISVFAVVKLIRKM
jgi:hypothetical protein